MAAFFWTIGPSVGGGQTMLLLVVGDVSILTVTSSAPSGSTPIPFMGFQPCIPGSQSLTIGPVPLSFLPLVASGLGCGAPGSVSVVPSGTSPSPTDPFTDGPNPFCDALTKSVDTIVGSGGSVTSPQGQCAAAQMSPALSAARSSFDSACAMLRRDQANVTAYTGIAAVLGAIAVGFVAAAATVGTANWIAEIVLALLALFFGCMAALFSYMAAQAAINVGSDESLLDSAQRAWESAVAAVKTACCPAWITVNTADLVCA
jgi:hypothetical protein